MFLQGGRGSSPGYYDSRHVLLCFTGFDLRATGFLIWIGAARKDVAVGEMVFTTKHSL